MNIMFEIMKILRPSGHTRMAFVATLELEYLINVYTLLAPVKLESALQAEQET